MKREELKELGLTDEQLGSVMALHGKTVTGLNTQINALESERDQFKEQLTSNQTELDTLKEASKGNEELSKQLEELQAKYDTTKSESESKLAQQKKDFAIRLALKDVNPLDEDIVLGQLNTDTIQVTDNGLQGLKEQVEALQESKAFLFQQPEQTATPTPQIVVPGNPNNQVTVDKKIEEYTYEELKQLKDSNPQAFQALTNQ